MTLEEEIFKKRELDTKKLLEYGFIKNNISIFIKVNNLLRVYTKI